MIIELIYEDHCGITQTKGHLLSLNKLRYKRLGMGGAALCVDDSILLATRGWTRKSRNAPAKTAEEKSRIGSLALPFMTDRQPASA